MSVNQRFVKQLSGAIDQLKADRVYKTLNHLDRPRPPECAWKAAAR